MHDRRKKRKQQNEMQFGRLLSAIVAGLTIAQATPIREISPATSLPEEAAAAVEHKEIRSQPTKYFREAR